VGGSQDRSPTTRDDGGGGGRGGGGFDGTAGTGSTAKKPAKGATSRNPREWPIHQIILVKAAYSIKFYLREFHADVKNMWKQNKSYDGATLPRGTPAPPDKVIGYDEELTKQASNSNENGSHGR